MTTSRNGKRPQNISHFKDLKLQGPVTTNFEETIHFDSEKSTIVLNCSLGTLIKQSQKLSFKNVL